MSSLILHGRRFFELEKWRHLRFAVNESFSTAADVSLHLQDGPKGHTFTVSNYLVESLGFTTKLAESISRKVSFNDKGFGFSRSFLLLYVVVIMASLILHGRRWLIELQKLLHSRFAVNIVQSAYPFSSAATVSRKGHNFTVSTYLVESLGFTLKLAEAISRRVSFNDKCNPDSVLNLFSTLGFTDSQISTIITGYPHVLIADSETCLGPKLKFLKSRGASTSELAEKLTPSSYLLPRGIKQKNKIRNISVLRELGMPQKLLFSLLASHAQLVCGKDKFEESLKKVLEMVFDPTTLSFVEALRVVYAFSDRTIEGRVEVYKRLGFSVNDVWAIFKKRPNFLKYSDKNIADSVETFLELGFSRDEFVMIVKCYPQCLGLSVETVKKKTEFLVNGMNWPIKAVVSKPVVLGLSMEKRIVRRCNVIKALMTKGLLGSELPSVSSVLYCTNDMFLERYVMKHDVDEQLVAELMGIFTRGPVSTK
ncbi:hypothetical protein DY000_02012720 [Brassica cretica]|uniref:Uncharacterized protein n=1 Tax=Brassica cretica TaxID=69181 RepID=A0ABQ7D9L6_BRACR|nr:hypothetical protein DY000_02012720 [Brassica cretica]